MIGFKSVVATGVLLATVSGGNCGQKVDPKWASKGGWTGGTLLLTATECAGSLDTRVKNLDSKDQGVRCQEADVLNRCVVVCHSKSVKAALADEKVAWGDIPGDAGGGRVSEKAQGRAYGEVCRAFWNQIDADSKKYMAAYGRLESVLKGCPKPPQQ